MLSAETAKFAIRQILFFLLTITRSRRLAKIKWSVYILKSQRDFCISFYWMDSSLCIYHLFVWLNFNLLYNCQCITLPTLLCLVLYSFWANLLCDWVFPLYYHISYICYFVVSYLFLLWYNWSWRYSVSLLRFPFCSPVQVLSCEISLVGRLECSYSCFSSHFLFSSYFRSVDPHVVCIVSGGYNQSSIALFYVIFELLYRCIDVIFNAGLAIRLYLKIPENFVHLILWTDSGLCIYHLFVWSSFNFWYNFQLITLPTKSYLVLYSFWANLHSLTIGLIISFISRHKLHFQFCCVLPILALI